MTLEQAVKCMQRGTQICCAHEADLPCGDRDVGKIVEVLEDEVDDFCEVIVAWGNGYFETREPAHTLVEASPL